MDQERPHSNWNLRNARDYILRTFKDLGAFWQSCRSTCGSGTQKGNPSGQNRRSGRNPIDDRIGNW